MVTTILMTTWQISLWVWHWHRWVLDHSSHSNMLTNSTILNVMCQSDPIIALTAWKPSKEPTGGKKFSCSRSRSRYIWHHLGLVWLVCFSPSRVEGQRSSWRTQACLVKIHSSWCYQPQPVMPRSRQLHSIMPPLATSLPLEGAVLTSRAKWGKSGSIIYMQYIVLCIGVLSTVQSRRNLLLCFHCNVFTVRTSTGCWDRSTPQCQTHLWHT